jgi:hypothetical protein
VKKAKAGVTQKPGIFSSCLNLSLDLDLQNFILES